MQRPGWWLGIGLSAVAAACGSTAANSVATTISPVVTTPSVPTEPEAAPGTTTSDASPNSVAPTTTADAASADADASSARSVADLAAAACEALTSPAVVERYAALTGGPIDEVRPCARVREGESQLGTAATIGSGLVVLANFTITDSADQMTVVGLYLPSVSFMNGVAHPPDMRAALPDDEVTAERTAAGHEYLLGHSSESLQIDVAGLLLAFNYDENEREEAPASLPRPAIDADGELRAPVRELAEAVVDAIHDLDAG